MPQRDASIDAAMIASSSSCFLYRSCGGSSRCLFGPSSYGCWILSRSIKIFDRIFWRRFKICGFDFNLFIASLFGNFSNFWSFSDDSSFGCFSDSTMAPTRFMIASFGGTSGFLIASSFGCFASIGGASRFLIASSFGSFSFCCPLATPLLAAFRIRLQLQDF